MNPKFLSEALAALQPADVARLFVNPETGNLVAATTLGKWRENIGTMPFWAVEKLIAQSEEFGPSTAEPAAPTKYIVPENAGHEKINPAWSKLPEWKKANLWIGCPSYSGMNTKAQFAIYALQAKHGSKIGFYPCENNPVGRARNILATHFLSLPNKPEWHFMMDGDMVVPFGNRELYSQAWGGPKNDPLGDMDILSRLVSHGKGLVGALYVGRSPTGMAQFAEAYENPTINRLAHGGPKDDLRPTKWVATGALLIHRTVYEEIAKTHPELKPRYEGDVYRFFAMEDDEGEDMLFCKRAREAGIQPYVDLGCHCGHEGSFIYWPHNTTPVPPKVAGNFIDPKERTAVVTSEERPTNPNWQPKQPMPGSPQAQATAAPAPEGVQEPVATS